MPGDRDVGRGTAFKENAQKGVWGTHLPHLGRQARPGGAVARLVTTDP